MRKYNSFLGSIPLLAIVLVAGSACGGASSQRQGQTLLAHRDFDGALALATQELKARPDSSRMHLLKIRALLGLGKSRAALTQYQRWHERQGAHDPEFLRVMAIDTLAILMAKADVRTRVQAIDIVVRFDIQQLLPTIEPYLVDRDELVAATAAIGVMSQTPRAHSTLTRLISSQNPRVRQKIASSLSKRGMAADASWSPVLLTLLGDHDAGVRRAALRALANRPHHNRHAASMAGLLDDTDDTVRATAVRILAKHEALTEPRLQAALGDSYLGVRLAATTMIASPATLHRLATNPQDIYLALRAAVILRRQTREVRADVIDRALADPRNAVRTAAITNIPDILPPKTAIQKLAGLLSHPAQALRLAAARTLAGMRRDNQSIPVLVDALSWKRPSHQLQACRTLIRLDDDRGFHKLEQLAQNAAPAIAARALRAHKAAHRPSMPLIEALGSPSPMLRLAASETLLALTR